MRLREEMDDAYEQALKATDEDLAVAMSLPLPTNVSAAERARIEVRRTGLLMAWEERGKLRGGES